MYLIKKFFALAFFITTCVFVHAQGKVTAMVTGFKNNAGVCKACLFNTAESFNGTKGVPVQCIQATIINGATKISFEKLPAGTYAISLFHDQNNNNKLDNNFLGIPREGYGASKNKLPATSAPSFADNSFIINNNNMTLPNIKLRYIF